MLASDTSAIRPAPAAAALDHVERSYVDWGAIVAGAVLAAALSFVLLTFGSAIGLGLVSPWQGEGVSALWLAIAAGLWLLWVQVSSFMAGGYLAGRLRRRIGDATPDEVDLRDGSHGLLVWGTGTLVGAMMLLGGVAGTVDRAAGTVAATAEAAAGLAPDGYLADRLWRGATADDPAARDEASTIVAMSVAAGGVEPADRAYLAELLASRGGFEPAAAEARIAEVEGRLAAAAESAVAGVDAARRSGVLVAFLAAASLLVSAAGAYFAATLGGRHRDAATDLPFWRAGR